jgi:FkbM family methyltransferase
MRIQHISPIGETHYIYREIFEQRSYLRHGVELHDDAVVVDVGANIGLFSLFAVQHFARVKTYAFEPIPETHAALAHNLATLAPAGSQVHLFEYGLGERQGHAEFAFFPNAPGNSTMHKAEKAAIRAVFEQDLREHGWRHSKLFALVCWLLFPFRRALVRWMVERIYRQVDVSCTIRRLSDVLQEQGVERVDLLKIDVEGAELEVLRGVRAEHWPRIRQVVMEIHDFDGRLAHARELLERHGFRITLTQGELEAKAATYNLYAVRA